MAVLTAGTSCRYGSEAADGARARLATGVRWKPSKRARASQRGPPRSQFAPPCPNWSPLLCHAKRPRSAGAGTRKLVTIALRTRAVKLSQPALPER